MAKLTFTRQQEREWRALLLGEPGGTLLPEPVTSGYTTDRVAAADEAAQDHLSIQPDVDAFARLICLKDTAPPLAIALFGAWGSGKTFFMRRLNHAIQNLCEKQKTAGKKTESGEAAFATDVLQIEFNAWTYSDQDLLASLAVEIFAKLLEHSAGENAEEADRKKRTDALLAKLHTAKESELAARQRVKEAEGRLATAKEGLSSAMEGAESARADVDAQAARSALVELAGQSIEDNGPLREALDKAGLGGSARNAAEVLALWQRTGDAAGRLGVLWRRLLRKPEENPEFMYLIGGVIAISVLPALFGFDGNLIVGQLSAAIGGTVFWANRALSTVDDLLKPVEAAAKAYDDQRKKIESDIAERLKDARAAMAKAEAAVTVREAELREKEAAVADAQAALDMDTPAGRLNRFIQERANASDYRRHLGVVRLLKEDFEQLSSLMTEETRSETLKRGTKKDTPVLPRLDRIVLYIDDLDRCKPSTVKSVMEAVHLLLSVDLFVVVVGADEKWVSKSLSEEYQSLLNDDPDSDQATSSDFIEKIFQIPFWLSPMTRNDMDGFLDGLLDGQVDRLSDEEKEMAEAASVEITKSVREKAAEREKEVASKLRTDEVFERPVAAPAVLPPPLPIRENVPALTAVKFTAAEVAFMKTLGPLIGRTPRAAKRYVNIYRLIRARLQGGQLRAFLGTADESQPPAYPIVQFLLALETSHEQVATALELRLQGSDISVSVLLDSIDALAVKSAATKEELRQGVDAIHTACAGRLPEDVSEWARRVARFSFRRSRWVV